MIQFKKNIELSENSFVVGGMLGANGKKDQDGYTFHALIFTKDENGNDSGGHLLCNSKAHAQLIGDQGVGEGDIDCANCIKKLERLGVSENH